MLYECIKSERTYTFHLDDKMASFNPSARKVPLMQVHYSKLLIQQKRVIEVNNGMSLSLWRTLRIAWHVLTRSLNRFVGVEKERVQRVSH